MSKLLTVLLLATVTQAFAGGVVNNSMSVTQAESYIQTLPCPSVEVWEQPGQCMRGQSDCTSVSTIDGAVTILKAYKSDAYKAVVIQGKESCSVLILNKSFDLNAPTKNKTN